MFIVQMLAKNLLFYGFSLFINDWEIDVGGPHVFATFGIVALCLTATSVPMCKVSPLDGLSYFYSSARTHIMILVLKPRCLGQPKSLHDESSHYPEEIIRRENRIITTSCNWK